MKRILGFVVAMGLMVGMMAAPAAANPDATQILSVGVFTGSATVGKVLTGACANGDQSGTVSGGGLGLPELKRNKTGWYKLSTALTTVPQGTGTLVACGPLAPALTLGKAAVGAACGASSSQDGFGTASAGTLSKKLRNLGWFTAVGGVLPVTGRTSEGATKKPGGHVLALVVATGGTDCNNKSATDPKPGTGAGSGARSFTVAGVFALVN